MIGIEIPNDVIRLLTSYDKEDCLEVAMHDLYSSILRFKLIYCKVSGCNEEECPFGDSRGHCLLNSARHKLMKGLEEIE